MSRQFWEEALAWATASGTAVANTTTETILFPNITIPANYMQDGRVLKLTAYGGYGTTGTPTLQFAIRWGGVSGTVLAQQAANVTTSGVGAGASMTAPWFLEAVIQTRSNGSTGTLYTMGTTTLFTSTLLTAGTVTNYGQVAPLTSGSGGGFTPAAVTVDLTADTALSLTADWGTANAANSSQGHVFTVEALNQEVLMIAICTPARDLVQGTFTCDMVSLVKQNNDVAFLMGFGTYIPILRSQLVQGALDQQATHILFIDSDMRFPPWAIQQLLKADKDVIGANCKQRSQDEWTARKNNKFISSTGKTGIEEVDTLGFGVTLIKASLFNGKLRKIPKPWFAMPYHTRDDKLVGEDVYFCTVAKENGFKIWIDHDLSQEVKHTGSKEF